MKESFLYASAAALVTALLIRAAPAEAQVAPVAPGSDVRVVQVADLNLDSQEGQRRLRLRLLHAARDVCGTPSTLDLRGRTEARECEEQIVSNGFAAGSKAFAAKQSSVIAVTATR